MSMKRMNVVLTSSTNRNKNEKNECGHNVGSIAHKVSDLHLCNAWQ
jgi:hypothetical protein